MTQVAVVMNDSKCSTYIVCLGADKEEPCPKGALAVAVVHLVLSIISFALLLCVILALKKEAWNSPVKRLCILLALFLGLQELLYASVGFCCGILPHELCDAVKFILLFLDTTVVLHFTVVLLMFLTQLGSPLVRILSNIRLKCKKYFEVTFHIITLLFTILLAVLQIIFYEDESVSSNKVVVFDVFLGCLLLGLLVFIILLVYLHIRFFKRQGILNTQVKLPLLSVSALFLLVIVRAALHVVSTYIIDDGNTLSLVVIRESVAGLEVLFLAVLFVLTYFRTGQCKICLRWTQSERTPLVARSYHALFHTNPVSEWDHTNDPSYTDFIPPPEMSDCVTDTSM